MASIHEAFTSGSAPRSQPAAMYHTLFSESPPANMYTALFEKYGKQLSVAIEDSVEDHGDDDGGDPTAPPPMSPLERELEDFKKHAKRCVETLVVAQKAYSHAVAKVEKMLALLQKLVELVSSTDDAGGGEDAQLLELLDTCLSKVVQKQEVTAKKQRYVAAAREYAKVHRTSRLLKEVDLSYTCVICWENMVNTILMPCGHTCCNACSTRLPGTCFMCKAVVYDTRRIYL